MSQKKDSTGNQLGGFGTARQRKKRRASGRMGGAGLKGFGSGGIAAEYLGGGRRRLRLGTRFRFLQTNNALVGNFPAKVFLLAALLVMLFEEDGASGICDERAGGWKADVSGAVLNIHSTAKKGRVTCHVASVQTDSSMVNSTNDFMRRILWKIVSSRNSFCGQRHFPFRLLRI